MPGLNVGPRKVPASLPGGLFSVADIVDAPDYILGDVIADPIVCGQVNTDTGWCFPVETPPLDKEPIGFSGFTDTPGNGDGFFTWLALECFLNGGSLASDAEQAFDSGEEEAVSSHVALLLSTLDLPIGGGTDIEDALGLAEGTIRTMSNGLAILGSPHTLTRLGGHVRHDANWNLFTRQGTPLASVPGLPPDTLYVTGQITLYRGSRQTREVPNTTQNRSFVLVERPWSAVIDCAVVSVGVTP
jgi:hypothetical protein